MQGSPLHSLREDDGGRGEGFALCAPSRRSLAGMRCLWGPPAPSSPFHSPMPTYSTLGLQLLALPGSGELPVWKLPLPGGEVPGRESNGLSSDH